jgi:type II secretion system protein D
MTTRFSCRLGLLALTLYLGLTLGASLQAQQFGGGGGGGGARIGGGGGGGGSSYGSTSRSSSSSSGSGSTARTYPNNGTIGDAYFSIDPETRRVIVIADAETSRYVSQVISNMDRPKPQVLIKCIFLEVTYNNASDIGLDGSWTKGLGDNNTANLANGFGMAPFANSTITNAFGQQSSSGFGPVSPMSAGGAGLYQIQGANYQVTLRAIAQSGKAKVLSRPSILARNNQPAIIKVGQSYPMITSVRYDNYGNAINAVSYKDIGVILQVTPFISNNGLIEMLVQPSISAVDPTTTVQISSGVVANAINQRAADTVAVTPDGQTVIIGGLIQDSKTVTDVKTPLLGDIPLLGNLFKRQMKSDGKTELIIFLTPHIVENPSQLAALSNTEQTKMNPSKSFTDEELNKFLDDLPRRDSKNGKAKDLKK